LKINWLLVIDMNRKVRIDELPEAMSAEEYLALHQQLVEEKSTTGANKSEEMVHYTELNWQRTKRVLKTLKIQESAREKMKNAASQDWVLITEPWCGDASQSTPVIIEMAKLNPKIRLRIILRDEHLDLMDQYLTNGGRAIPKLLRINPETQEVIADWGPRPLAAQELFASLKKADLTHEQISIELQNWYNKDKGQTVQSELLNLAINE
jgi:hypothetical protein